MKKIVYSALVVLSIVGMTSCSRDFTETQFFQEEQAAPITTAEQLESFVRGTYLKMRATNYLGNKYRATGQIHTDETYSTTFSGRNIDFATYSLLSTSADPEDIWYAIGQTIGNANIVINSSDNLTYRGTANAQALTQVKYLKGQAYALRAQALFDLLKLYGQEYSGGSLGVVVPLVYNPNAQQARSTVAETRAQIESDFQAALDNLGTTGKVADKTYLNQYSVKALMSRYYLYKGDYAKVIQYAGDVINSGKYSVIPASELAISFTKENAANSVFELAVGLNGAAGTNSYANLVNSAGYKNIAVLPNVYNSYESGDVRKDLIVQGIVRSGQNAYFLNGKFSDVNGNSNIKVIRYEEVLLNAAEAEIQAGSSVNALNYYNKIRQARGLAAASSVTLDLIKKERTLELIGEGLRYWDLLRWNSTIPYYNKNGVRVSSDPDNSKIGDKSVGNKLLAFPIPRKETASPGSLVVSNPGYDN
jgi:putative outer membrane protein, probably involved in nutrient binding